MTICAGFKCSDGIVLCADAQETVSDFLKLSVPKVVARPAEQGKPEDFKIVACGAGDGPFIDKLVDEMWLAGASSAESNIETAAKNIEASILETHTRYWKLNYPAGHKPEANMIYAIATDNQFQLYASVGPIVNAVETFEVAGSGGILAKYIGDRMFSRVSNTTAEAMVLAVHILSQVTKYVEGCGGALTIISLYPDGRHAVKDRLETALETANFVFLDKLFLLLLTEISNLQKSDEDVQRAVEKLSKDFMLIRAAHKGAITSLQPQLAKLEQLHPLGI